jgi:hypothetical protein
MTSIAERLKSEQAATRTDAERRLSELYAVRVVLWPDRADPLVLSELLTIMSQIDAAREVVGE